MKKIKVLHLISTDIYSGAENVACQIINAFKSNENYDMIYCSPIGKNVDTLNSMKINFLGLEKFSYNKIKKAVEEYKPDIIHAHDIKASIMASLFYRSAEIVSHIHCNHENMRKINLKTLLYLFSINKYKKIIWVSNSALEQFKFKKKVQDKSIVLYNVIDSQKIKDNINRDKEQYSYDAIYLGRLNYAKNPLKLVDIVNLVSKEYNNFKLAIVGTGDLEEVVKNKVKELNLNKNVDFFGYMVNPYKILYSSKIMLMTSRYEGTPMCALEAISLGKPIISTPTDGLCEIVENGVNGFLTNSNEEFAERILYLLNNKDIYNEFSKKSLKANQRINNIETYVERIKNIYE